MKNIKAISMKAGKNTKFTTVTEVSADVDKRDIVSSPAAIRSFVISTEHRN
jgi:hypothetical protein